MNKFHQHSSLTFNNLTVTSKFIFNIAFYCLFDSKLSSAIFFTLHPLQALCRAFFAHIPSAKQDFTAAASCSSHYFDPSQKPSEHLVGTAS